MLWFVTAGPITKLFEWGLGPGTLSQGAPSMRQDEATTTSTGSTTEIHHVCPQQLYFVLPSYTLVLLLFIPCLSPPPCVTRRGSGILICVDGVCLRMSTCGVHPTRYTGLGTSGLGHGRQDRTSGVSGENFFLILQFVPVSKRTFGSRRVPALAASSHLTASCSSSSDTCCLFLTTVRFCTLSITSLFVFYFVNHIFVIH
jgi:hypothetical protein